MRGIEHMPRLYDAAMAVMELFGLSRARQWVASGVSGRVLEVGCGTGRNLPRYAGASFVVGSDPDWGVLVAAKRRAASCHFVAAAAEALPFPDRTFDVAVSSLVLCSVADPGFAVAELARVAPKLRALEHVRSTCAWQARLQDASQPLWTWITGGCHPNRDTERAIGTAFTIEKVKARGTMRRIEARAK